jgi:anti-anti-sigma regulatory factor
MSGDLSFKKEKRGTDVVVALNGDITEYAPWDKLIAQIDTPAVVFDLGDVKRINSCGVRDWLRMIRLLESKGVAIVLDRCSVPIVHSLTMISGFEGNGRIRSLFVPYYCEVCNVDSRRLYQVDSGGSVLDGEPCPKCRNKMEFDDLPELYARWINRA